MLQGGFGSAVLEAAADLHVQPFITRLGVEDRYIQHGDHKHLLTEIGLDDESIAQCIRTTCQKGVQKNG